MINKEVLPIAEIQNWMQAMLIQHVPISHLDVTTADMVNDSKRLSAAQHLTIYRQSYIARLRACMQSQFKCLAHALGELLFQDFADEYLDSNPSASYTLNNLGEKFPLFLEMNRPDAESEEKEEWPDFMIELAAFEYALSEIFDMQGTDDINIPDSNTPDHLLITSPTLHLFEYKFPICSYYLDFNANLSPNLPFPQKSHCAVSRQNYKLGLFNLGIDQYYFLNCIKEGASIQEAKDKLIEFYNFERSNFEKIWPIWRRNFIVSGFLVCKNDA
ncbi:HvfC/BufC N-terminal domain-containing protein [Flavobacterium cerinum]|uniref:DUF2063 domain-containing protein n=1 Tax=Flavobacterium cerinum TaxID=2502784 RepID=A0A444HBW9_9FLAO|nr:DNA-binding domain-containing protein [Flavobacterium cerinum]RWX00964.1 DUF2063 domain-containing protein [Flavobacterium cerinum]